MMVYMTQYSTNAFYCRISFIPDDGLRISRNVEQKMFSIIVAVLFAIDCFTFQIKCRDNGGAWYPMEEIAHTDETLVKFKIRGFSE